MENGKKPHIEDLNIEEEVIDTTFPNEVEEENSMEILENTIKDLDDYVEKAIEEDILALNAMSIKKNKPKFFKLVENFVKEELNSQNQDIEPSKEDIESATLAVLIYNARAVLYKLFDDNKVYINIVGGGDDWVFRINGDSIGEAKTRTKAEKKAIDLAIDIIEERS